jgi:hypothetical protein
MRQSNRRVHTRRFGSNSDFAIVAARIPNPHTASGPSTQPDNPNARSIPTSLIAAVTKAPSPC